MQKIVPDLLAKPRFKKLLSQLHLNPHSQQIHYSQFLDILAAVALVIPVPMAGEITDSEKVRLPPVPPCLSLNPLVWWGCEAPARTGTALNSCFCLL